MIGGCYSVGWRVGARKRSIALYKLGRKNPWGGGAKSARKRIIIKTITQYFEVLAICQTLH